MHRAVHPSKKSGPLGGPAQLVWPLYYTFSFKKKRQMLVRIYFRMNSTEMIYTSTGTSLALPRASLMML